MRSSWRIRDGGADSADPGTRAGPSNRSGHCARRRGSECWLWASRTLFGQAALETGWMRNKLAIATNGVARLIVLGRRSESLDLWVVDRRHDGRQTGCKKVL